MKHILSWGPVGLAAGLTLVFSQFCEAQRPMTPMERQARQQTLSVGALSGNSSKILKLDKLDGSKVKTPEYGVRGYRMNKVKTREWFEVVCEYKTAPKWVDELTFRYYLLTENSQPERGENPFNLFSGEVTYINIEEGDHESMVYLHPSTLRRFGDVKHIAVIVYSQGQKVGEASTYDKPNWWEQLSPRQDYILNRMETPFGLVGFDNFEAIRSAPGR